MSKSNIRIFRLEHRYFWVISCLLILLTVIMPTAAADKANHARGRYSGPTRCRVWLANDQADLQFLSLAFWLYVMRKIGYAHHR